MADGAHGMQAPAQQAHQQQRLRRQVGRGVVSWVLHLHAAARAQVQAQAHHIVVFVACSVISF